MNALALAFAMMAPFLHGEDLPPLSDLNFLPDANYEAISFNRQLAESFRKQQALRLHLYWELGQMAADADDVCHAWELISWARATVTYDYEYQPSPEYWLRVNLAELRDLIGPQNYYAGRIPPAPLWRMGRE